MDVIIGWLFGKLILETYMSLNDLENDLLVGQARKKIDIIF